MKMTDYTNPRVMKGAVKKARNEGIFAIGENKRATTNTYILKLNKDNARALEMIKKEESYGYQLIQIDFEMALSELIKPIRVSIAKKKGEMFNKYIYEVKVTQIKDDSSRAWDKVSGKVLTLYFRCKKGHITQIKTRESKR